MDFMDKHLKTALALVFIVVFVAFSLTACQKSQNSASIPPQPDILTPIQDTVVAKVGSADILYSEVQRAAIEQGLIEPQAPLTGRVTPDVAPMAATAFNMALDSLIDQKLLAQDAQREGIDKTDEAKRRLAVARERLLSSMRIETYIRDTVTEAAMRKLYDTQAEFADFGDEIRARHIVVESEDDALELAKQLSDDGDFEALAADLSIDVDTRDRGGDLGYFTYDMLAPDFVGPIFASKKGQAIAPFETGKGWHIVQVLDRRSPDAKSYEDSREALRNFLTFDAIETLTRQLREQGDVKRIAVNPSYAPIAKSDK